MISSVTVGPCIISPALDLGCSSHCQPEIAFASVPSFPTLYSPTALSLLDSCANSSPGKTGVSWACPVRTREEEVEVEAAQHVGTVTPEEDAKRALCLRQEPRGCPPAWELRLFGSKCMIPIHLLLGTVTLRGPVCALHHYLSHKRRGNGTARRRSQEGSVNEKRM